MPPRPISALESGVFDTFRRKFGLLAEARGTLEIFCDHRACRTRFRETGSERASAGYGFCCFVERPGFYLALRVFFSRRIVSELGVNYFGVRIRELMSGVKRFVQFEVKLIVLRTFYCNRIRCSIWFENVAHSQTKLSWS